MAAQAPGTGPQLSRGTRVETDILCFHTQGHSDEFKGLGCNRADPRNGLKAFPSSLCALELRCLDSRKVAQLFWVRCSTFQVNHLLP